MKTSRLTSRIRLGEGVLLLLVLSLASVPFFQTRVTKGLQIDFQSRQGVVKEIESNLQAISLSLLGYLQDHSTEHLTRIKIAGKEVNHLIRVYKEDAVAGLSKDPQHLEARYDALRKTTIALLEADTAEKDDRAALAQTGAALVAVFTDKIRPTLRPNQLSAYARMQAVLEAESEARALSHEAADAGRFRRSMDAYQEFARARNARMSVDEAERLFRQGQGQIKDIGVAVEQKKERLNQFSEAYRDLSEALESAANRGGPLPSSGLRAWVFGIPKSVILLLAGMLFLALSGVLLIDRLTVKRMVQPVQALIMAAEAAATGDLSRTPELLSQSEIGRLSSAVHRLINVLGRSENLVYHLAALVEASGDAIISQNLEGAILSWNKGAQRIYGYSADEVKGRSILLLMPNAVNGEMEAVVQQIKQGERVKPFEMVHTAKNGRIVRAFVRAAAILGSTREIIGVSICAQEIPEIGGTSVSAPALNLPEVSSIPLP